ncbi:PaaI family thioesterase [Bacillus sp. 1P10SD]|uniref:PaaI family thioesterase n=1 Tax=Bacillus sp. 1P10SD TaxID=3132265 RepID=UPI0039A63FE1
MSVLNNELLKYVEDNPFNKHIGFELINDQEDEILLKLWLKEELLNTNKTVHGGVHASMLDTVNSIVLQTIYQTPVAAMNLDVHYFSPANSGHLLAKANILQQGYKLATIEAEIVDEYQQLIAKGTGIYRIIRKA